MLILKCSDCKGKILGNHFKAVEVVAKEGGTYHDFLAGLYCPECWKKRGM